MDELFNEALQSATSPADDGSTKNDSQSSALFKDTGDGSDQKKNGDTEYANITDPTSATQATYFKFGDQARNNFNKDAYDEARQDGFARNFQEGDKNIPIESKFANYNNMSWEDTQRLSRLADAYNSGKHWQRGKISLDGTGADSRYVQNTPIETEEMRRANMTRQGLQQQQSYALSRANDILAYPQKLTEAFDKLGMDADAAAMEIQRNFADYAQRAQYDMKFRGEYEQALQKGMLYWTEEMMQFQKSKVAKVLYDEMANNPQYAQWVAANLVNAPLPSQQQYLANMITAQIQRSGMMGNLRYEEILSQVESVIGKLTGYENYQSQLMAGYGAGQAGYGTAAGGRAAITGKLR